jgi:polysaccharide export outer membrane protein
MAGLVLGACGTVQRQPDVGAPAGSRVVPAIPAEAPVASAGVKGRAQTGSHARDVNVKLQSLPRTDEEGDLPLGAGDLIEVSVFDVPELSSIKLRIPQSGLASLPLIGSVTASGRTALELQSDIASRLQLKYMHDPQVSVFVHEHRSQRISVMGSVRQGGVFTLTHQLRLADALALAGGITEDAGPMVYVVRRAAPQSGPASTGGGAPGQAMTVVDLESLAEGKQELNLPLMAGDVIEVARAGTFYVGGEVNKPGAYLLKTRTTLDQAAMTAGGLRDVADWDDVRLYRARPDGTKEYVKFTMSDFEDGKPGPELQANDVVIVGKSGVKTVLYGLRDFFRMGLGMTIP